MGTFINAGLIIAGGLLGLLFKKRISERVSQGLTMALGIGVLLIGLANTLVEMIVVDNNVISSKNGLILIVSLAVGTLIGSVLNLQGGIDKMENFLIQKYHKSDITKGFVEASILYCVGAMAIIGSFADGIHGDISVLVTKGIMDGISSLILASTLGYGVILSFLPVLIYQGALTVLSRLLTPTISPEFLSLFSLVGFSLVICIGLNILKITKIKVVNMLPALVIPVLYILLF